jgi:hypothetical protein
MSTAYYEIMVLPSGEVALKRADDEGEPLLKISFSRDAKEHLNHQHLEIARAMITTGVQLVEEAVERNEPKATILH